MNNIITDQDICTIQGECSNFLEESSGIPLYKILPIGYQNTQRVKVRLKKDVDDIANCFNKAFEPDWPGLRQRAVFAYPTIPSIPPGMDLFYVFPIDSYKFLYSTEVTNSSLDYQHVIDVLFETFQDNNKVIEIVSDLLKYTYVTDNLYSGLHSNAEIVFYGIPYYYAVRASTVNSYKQLLTNINTIQPRGTHT